MLLFDKIFQPLQTYIMCKTDLLWNNQYER